MTNALRHRGPDDGGYWTDDAAGYAVGHRRLSIVDLSEAGSQPMVSESGRYVLAFNGEIYNHRAIRSELESLGLGANWRGHADTETLLQGIQVWGLDATLRKCVGMFALSLWDRETRTLMLARDRFGEKPLYYGWVGRAHFRMFAFASEPKALVTLPNFDAEISQNVVGLYVQYGYVPGPYSIYEDISKLEPGAILTLQYGAHKYLIDKYWNLETCIREAKDLPLQLDAEETVDSLHQLLMEAVGLQMEADVPLGAFLSGGIDSSLITSLMQAQSTKPVKTFTIGFGDSKFDESVHAEEVARHLGTDHTCLRVGPDAAMAVIQDLQSIYCEPFADVSQIPTFLVSKLARQHVTVSLSGDAGDELFGGYNRHKFAAGAWQHLSKVPVALRTALGCVLAQATPEQMDRWGGKLASTKFRNFGDKVHKAALALSSQSTYELYSRLSSNHQEAWKLLASEHNPSCDTKKFGIADLGLSDAELMMALDMKTYLTDDILVKVDRAAMANSLETRVPFLDHRIVEYAWRLPVEYKIRNGEAKWPLKQILDRYVPREMFERPKMGFAVPIGDWLRGPLKEWAASLLSPHRLSAACFWNAQAIEEAWTSHLSGRRNMAELLWPVLMFEAWRETC